MSERAPRRPSSVAGPETTTARVTVTPRELVAEHLTGNAVSVVGTGRRTLVVRGMAFATVGPDAAAITPVCAVSARDLPVVDVLAALASQHPSGVLVIETSDDAFAFEVNRGRLDAAHGLGALDQLEPYVAEVHRRHPSRFGPDAELGEAHPGWMRVARAFVEERVLDQLTLGRVPGTRMTLFRGDIEWLGTRLPEEVGPTLGHVLLEHARRFDELPKILEALGDLERLAIPIAEPGERPVARAPNDSEDAWDFFSDPDPAAIAEWNDALAVWTLCDGESSLDEIIEGAMLGRFRGMLALRTLAAARCVVLIEPVQARDPASDEVADEAVESADVIALHLGIESDPGVGDSLTGYSIVPKRAPPHPSRGESASRATPRAPSAAPRPSQSPAARSAQHPASPRASAPIVTAPGSEPVTAPAPDQPQTQVPAAEASTPRAARSLAAARALDGALPSPTTVMLVLGATAIVALVASIVALV